MCFSRPFANCRWHWCVHCCWDTNRKTVDCFAGALLFTGRLLFLCRSNQKLLHRRRCIHSLLTAIAQCLPLALVVQQMTRLIGCILQGASLGVPPPFLCRACIGSTHKKCRGTSPGSCRREAPGSWRSLYSRVPISLYHETDVRSKWKRRARLVRTKG